MQNPLSRLPRCELPHKAILRLGAFIAKQAILRPVRDSYIEIWPDRLNSAQLIQDEAYRTERAIAVGDKVIVGVNRYTETEEGGAPLLFRPDERVMAEQAERLATHRAERDLAAVDTAIAAVKRAATSDETLMPRILDAVRVEATLGEICGALRAVFGEYQPPATI